MKKILSLLLLSSAAALWAGDTGIIAGIESTYLAV
jgi:hypothetical protein